MKKLKTILLPIFILPNTHILPVERNSIFVFSKELSLSRHQTFDFLQKIILQQSKVDNKESVIESIFKNTTRYPKPIRDSLTIAEDLANLSKRTTEFQIFAEYIEKQILEGIVSVSKDGEVVFASERVKNIKFPIHLSASVVKTLSNLIFYLKHLANKGDLIIIDEPELNLHPDNQILLTRIFAQMIHQGFKLLISTHSDYIVREMNNLIMLSSPKKELADLAERYGYLPDQIIKQQDIGVHFFKFNGKNKVSVKSVKISQEGFAVDSIDNTIEALNERSEELFTALKYA